MRVVLVGGAGYVGRHLARHLETLDISVVSLSSTNGSGMDPNTGLFPDDFRLPESVDVVVYLSQSPYFRDAPRRSTHLLAVNALSPVTLAGLAIKAGASRFVYLSTGSVYAPTFEPLTERSETSRTNWYGLSKLHAEEALALLRSEIDIAIVRPFAIYGPAQVDRLIPNLINSVKKSLPIKLQAIKSSDVGNDGLVISLCYIDDVVQILSKVIMQGGVDTLNLAGQEALSIRKISNLIGEQLNIQPKFFVDDLPRGGDLVADISYLREIFEIKFTEFEEGLKNSLKIQS